MTRAVASWTKQQLARNSWKATPAATAARLSEGRWQRAAHLQVLSDALRQAAFTPNSRLIVSMPPRHGKSELVSHWFPVWYLDRKPDKQVILCSYEAEFARSWGRKVRNEIRGRPGAKDSDPSEGFRRSLRVRIDPTSTAAAWWSTIQGGGMLTSGVGGPITGKGADVLVIDDPIKNFAEAYSPTFRQSTWDWFTSTAMPRLEPGASVIVVMTRWHEDDLIGRILAHAEAGGEQWDHIRFTALAGPNDPLGRKLGEALWPARYTRKDLLIVKRRSSYVWAGLYDQLPAPEEGGLVKRSWWKFYDPDVTLPEFERVILSWDMNFKSPEESKSGKTDYVAGHVWGKIGPDVWLIGRFHQRVGFPKTLKALEDQVKDFPEATAKLIEDTANGPAIISTARQTIPGLIPITPIGGKVARLVAVTPFIEGGNVYLPDPIKQPWAQEVIDECAVFPGGKHDDDVDALSQALNYLYNEPVASVH